MKFDERLISLRKQKGFSQEDLGNQMGVSRQTISKWESGQTTPEMIRLKELSKIFEISVDELIDNEIILKKENEKTEEKEVKINLKSTNILIIISCVLIVLGFISSMIFYAIGKDNIEIGRVLYISYTTEYSDKVDIVEIYTFDEDDKCISINCYANCNNTDDSKEVANILTSNKSNLATNIIINDCEVTWRENSYKNFSLKKLIENKEKQLNDKTNFKMKEL